MTSASPPVSGDTAGSSTVDRIIEAALTMIASEGLGSVTMIGIANAAGVARQTLYNHYPDVDSIVTAAIGRHNRQSIEMLESSLRVVEGPVDKLRQLVRHVVSVGAHAHHQRGLQHGLSADARATLGAYDEKLDQHIREVLETGRDMGFFRSDLELDVDTSLIRHMLEGLAILAARKPIAAADLAATGMRTVLASVAAD